jgi:hypothetical protein
MSLITAFSVRRRLFFNKKISLSGNFLWIADHYVVVENLNFLYNNSSNKKFTFYDFGKQNHSIIDTYNLVMSVKLSEGIIKGSDINRYLNSIYNHLLCSTVNETICLFNPTFAPFLWLKRILVFAKQKKINLIVIQVDNGAQEQDYDFYKNLLSPYIDFLLIFNIREPFYLMCSFDLKGFKYRDFRLESSEFLLFKSHDLFRPYRCSFFSK